jgi:hypothetical protein
MPAGNYDFVGVEAIEQGATWRKQTTYKDSNLVPYDLTGFKAKMQARRSYAAPDPIIDLTTENGGITLGGTAGTINLFLSATQTAALYVYQGIYDLDLISPGGDVLRYLQGYIDISQGVTK